MVNKKNSIIVLAVIAVSVGALLFLRSESPEAQVRKRLDDLCSASSKAIGESTTTRIIKAETLNTMFADPVEISGDASILGGTYTPEELSSRIFTGSRMFETIRLSYTDLSVTVADNSNATASFTAKVSAIAKVGGQSRQDEFREVAASLTRNDDDKWVFTQFKIISVMER